MVGRLWEITGQFSVILRKMPLVNSEKLNKSMKKSPSGCHLKMK